MSEKNGKKYLETGINNLMIIPDPNDTIIFIEGRKWYSWTCEVKLSDLERDQLISVLQGMKQQKEKAMASLVKKTEEYVSKMEVEKIEDVIPVIVQASEDKGSEIVQASEDTHINILQKAQELAGPA